MPREFDVVIERDSEGYYVASVPALRGCHTQARSLDELIERIREAIELCLAAEGEDEEPLSDATPIRRHAGDAARLDGQPLRNLNPPADTMPARSDDHAKLSRAEPRRYAGTRGVGIDRPGIPADGEVPVF